MSETTQPVNAAVEVLRSWSGLNVKPEPDPVVDAVPVDSTEPKPWAPNHHVLGTPVAGWDQARLEKLLETSDIAVMRALQVLYDRQTAQEKSGGVTINKNAQGFTAFDADIFSSFVRWIRAGHALSARQLAVCRKRNAYGIMRLGKYYRQLLEEIARKQTAGVSSQGDF
jgi:hypothetical protein